MKYKKLRSEIIANQKYVKTVFNITYRWKVSNITRPKAQAIGESRNGT